MAPSEMRCSQSSINIVPSETTTSKEAVVGLSCLTWDQVIQVPPALGGVYRNRRHLAHLDLTVQHRAYSVPVPFVLRRFRLYPAHRLVSSEVTTSKKTKSSLCLSVSQVTPAVNWLHQAYLNLKLEHRAYSALVPSAFARIRLVPTRRAERGAV